MLFHFATDFFWVNPDWMASLVQLHLWLNIKKTHALPNQQNTQSAVVSPVFLDQGS